MNDPATEEKREEKGYLRREVRYRSFSRSLPPRRGQEDSYQQVLIELPRWPAVNRNDAAMHRAGAASSAQGGI